MDTLGEKIYNLRKQRGVSQEELGFALNVSRQTISRWETDTVKPTVENLESLTKFFEVNSNYFLSAKEIVVDEGNGCQRVNEKAVKKEPKFKILKVLVLVASIALLACGVIIFGIAAYVTISPVQGQEVVNVNRFNNAGIVFLTFGFFCSVIFIALLILFIKDKKK